MCRGEAKTFAREEKRREREASSKGSDTVHKEKKSPEKSEGIITTTHTSKMGTNREDATLKIPVFHGTGRDNAKQYWFTCDAIWVVKQIADDNVKIAQLETTFRERALTWYMKFKATTPMS